MEQKVVRDSHSIPTVIFFFHFPPFSYLLHPPPHFPNHGHECRSAICNKRYPLSLQQPLIPDLSPFGTPAASPAAPHPPTVARHRLPPPDCTMVASAPAAPRARPARLQHVGAIPSSTAPAHPMAACSPLCPHMHPAG
jgi:hypothetical protein